MIGLIDQASSLYYAARTQKLESSISHVYGVVQCSRDLSLQNCTRCLQQNVIEYTSCCRGRQGGTISRPSCFIRWEVYPFLALLDNMPPLEKGKIMYHNLCCSQVKQNMFEVFFFLFCSCWFLIFILLYSCQFPLIPINGDVGSCRWKRCFYRNYCGNCHCSYRVACSRICYLEEEKIA